MFRLVIAATALIANASGVDLVDLTFHEQSGRLAIRRANEAILIYSFASNQFKPYVKELRTLRGENVLLDAPADHLHHHGLMYAIRINGTNFWEELPASGRQKHIRFLDRRARGTNAAFTELVHWMGPQGNEPLLIEERSIELNVNPVNRELALQWTGRFTVGQRKVTLHGSAYNGLGLRLPAEWNGVARHQNSENLSYSAAHTWDVTPARWATVSLNAVTLVLFGSPSNWGETRFFSMNNPFTYLSVTQNLEQKPLRYAPGERFELKHQILVCEESKSTEALNTRYEQWIK
jgi:hypothetical protein